MTIGRTIARCNLIITVRGKSGQRRAMHRLSAGSRVKTGTDSATENNFLTIRRDKGENVG